MSYSATIINDECLVGIQRMFSDSLQMCVTSPPYFGLRDYGVNGQIGLEKTPDEYVTRLVEVFREVWRVLRDDGTLWLNLGDSYASSGANSGSRPEDLTDKQRSNAGCVYERRKAPVGLKPKDLIGIPWRVAFALQADGWYLRSDIIWAKPNPMPESVRDRPTRSHEHLFLFSKSERYYYDADAIKEPLVRPDEVKRKTPGRFGGANKFIEASKQSRLHSGNVYTGTSDGKRNKRDVWTIAPKPYRGAHFAVMPEALVEPCVLAGSKPGDTVLDPFAGSGTVGVVALRHGRRFVGVELNKEYCELAKTRIGTVDNTASEELQKAC